MDVITSYSKALDLLDDYDHKTLKKYEGNKSNQIIAYEECLDIIGMLKFNSERNLFTLERDKGLKSIINNIYQSFDGKDIYESVEEKGANFLYMIVKDHVLSMVIKELQQHYLFTFYSIMGFCIKITKK